MSELTVILKDESRTYKQKFLMYETFSVSEKDEVVRRCIHEAIKSFGGEPDSVKVRILLHIE